MANTNARYLQDFEDKAAAILDEYGDRESSLTAICYMLIALRGELARIADALE